MRAGIFATPRPEPARLVPAAGAGIVLLVALVIFVLAGWTLAGWALGAVLWAGLKAIDFLLTRVRGRMDNLAASGVLAFVLFFKTVAVLAVFVAVAVSDPHLAVAGAVVFALAYTFDLGLSLVSYFGGTR